MLRKFPFYIVLLLFSSSEALAQNWEEHIISNLGIGVISATAGGDLNNDGNLDLFVAGREGAGWFSGDDNGNFTFEEQFIRRSSDGCTVTIADTDNDGDKDIIYSFYKNLQPPPYASLWETEIYLVENEDNTGFATPVLVSTDLYIGIIEIIATDIDYDGDLDMLVSCFGETYYTYVPNSSISWKRNEGGNFFTTLIPLSQTIEPWIEVLSIDVDGDDVKDIVYSSSWHNDTILWRKNLSGGFFDTATVITNGHLQVTAFEASDIDGDGDKDILVLSNHHDLSYIECLQGDSFGVPTLISNQMVDADICAVDIDNDGDMDIMTSSAANDSTLIWFENAGSLSFVLRQMATTFGSEAIFIDNLKIDNDTLDDLILSYGDIYSNGRLAWHKNLSGGNLSQRNDITPGIIATRDLFAYDILEDGNEDILAYSYQESSASRYSYLGNEIFDSEEVLFPEASAIYFGDIDNDGDDDPILFTADRQLVWRENMGNGSFGNSAILFDTLPYSMGGFLFEDLDGDSMQDIIYCDYPGIKWRKNMGGGNFSLDMILTTDIGSFQLVFSDVDGDGLKDIIGISSGVFWLKNLGNNTFNNIPTYINNLSYQRGVHCLDMDNDNDNDIVVVRNIGLVLNVSYYAFYLYENMGNGTFTGGQSGINQSQWPFDLADIEGDGDVDIITSRLGSLIYFENLGGFNFNLTPDTIAPDINYYINAICATDINNDGNIDVAAASGSTKISWFENPGNLVNIDSKITPLGASIYPNPNNGSFTINLGKVSDNTLVTITSINGQLLNARSYNHAQLINLEIDGAAGMYFVTIETESRREMIKVIKE